VQRFREWRCEHGRYPDAALTADDACTWLAELADRGAHKASTLVTYAAALSNWFDTEQRHPDNVRPNPMSSPSVRRLLAGIANAQAQREQERPLDEQQTGSTPLTLPSLRLYTFDISQPRDRMYRAAAYLGVCLALRISELLGSSLHPERAIRTEQLAFFTDAAALTPLPVDSTTTAVPIVLQLVLRATKTQHLAPTVKVCAVAEAVQAVWQWARECHTAGRPLSARLFQLQDRLPISSYALMKFLQRRHQAAGLGAARFTGKSLRRGGASTLAAAGVDEEHIARLGWGLNSSVWKRYANEHGVQRQRAIQQSRLMEADCSGSAAASMQRRA
jgi:hypothetical protein